MPGDGGVTARACCSVLWRMSLSHGEGGKERVLHTSLRVGYCRTGSLKPEMPLESEPHVSPGPRTVLATQSIAESLRFRAMCLIPEGSRHTADSPPPPLPLFWSKGQADFALKRTSCARKNLGSLFRI